MPYSDEAIPTGPIDPAAAAADISLPGAKGWVPLSATDEQIASVLVCWCVGVLGVLLIQRSSDYTYCFIITVIPHISI